MFTFRRILFLVLIFLAGNEILSVGSQDVSSFLGELMKNYVAKNTRYYTMVNGVPVQESETAPTDNKEIMSRISSILPSYIANSPVLGQILDQDANSFPNSWTPMMAEVPSPSASASSNAPSNYLPQPYPTIGRRNGEEVYRYAQQYLPEESRILTLADVGPREPAEFNIQSTMSF